MTALRAALLPGLLAAAGYALLELAFFAPRNLLLPWSPEHGGILGLFFLLHAIVALAALGAAAVLTRFAARPLAGTLPFFAPLAALVAIHAVSHYRERMNALPRDLTGTLVTLGIVALAVALAFALARASRDSGRARRLATVLSVIPVVFGIGKMIIAEPVGVETASAPRHQDDRLRARETGQRVLVFGFDGATWDVVDPLIAAGRMPNLAALAARGRTLDLESIRPTFSPVIWTSVATGKDRFAHGIHDVVQTRLPGGTLLRRSIPRTAFYTKTVGVACRALNARHFFDRVPYRSHQVRATSVFEAASEAGLSTSLVEWYVTWPARSLTGVNVSDRFHLARDGFEGIVSPTALGDALADHIVTSADVPVEDVLALADLEGLDAAETAAWQEENGYFVSEMRYNLARDLTTRNVAVDLLSRDEEWRLFGVYFRSVDLSHHLTWSERKNDGSRLRTAVDRYHEVMDGVVGEVLANVPDEAVVLLLSDHGFEDRYAHSRAPTGIAIVAGGPTVVSPDRGRIGVYDVAPTVAALVGLPVANDLAGEARLDLFDPAFSAAHPPASISTWERDRPDDEATVVEDESVEAAELERLRALGYIQ